MRGASRTSLRPHPPQAAARSPRRLCRTPAGHPRAKTKGAPHGFPILAVAPAKERQRAHDGAAVGLQEEDVRLPHRGALASRHARRHARKQLSRAQGVSGGPSSTDALQDHAHNV